MAHVFLSYSREDEAEAKRIAAALEETGLEVWWDRTIPPGKTFDQVIEEALDDSSWALVLWSETSIESNWVKAEAEEALRRGILVPVLIDHVRPPLAFRRIEAAELQDWDGDARNPEFSNLLKVMGKDAPPPPKVSKRTSKPKPAPAPIAATRSPAGMSAGAKVGIGVGAAAAVLFAVLIGINMGRAGSDRPTTEQIERRPAEVPASGSSTDIKRQATETQPPPEERSVKQQAVAATQRDIKAQPVSPPPPSTGTITLRYTGDAYDCTLDLQITVADQTIIPQSNIGQMYNIPLGTVSYSVSGVISCPTVGVCNASGSGQLNAVNGGLYDLFWQNTSYAHCDVSFVQSG